VNRLADWLDAAEAIWVDEARARMQIRLLGVIASGLGWTGFDDMEDPADILDPNAEPAPSGAPERATDPAARAAQLAAFFAAVG
jgi:hypothetical protein